MERLILCLITLALFGFAFYESGKKREEVDGKVKLPNPVFHWTLAIVSSGLLAYVLYNAYAPDGLWGLIAFIAESGITLVIFAVSGLYGLYLPPLIDKKRYWEIKEKAKAEAEEIKRRTREGDTE